MANEVTFSPAEFKQLPLDYIISAPLITTIKAHALAARTSLEFIKEFANGKETFTINRKKTVIDAAGNQSTENTTLEIDVPLLALVTTPSLNFDSLSVGFEYNIAQVYKDKSEKQWNADAKIGGSKWLSKFVDIGLSGGVSGGSSQENTINKSGKLDIKLHISQAPTPPALAKIVNAMTESISDMLENETPDAPAAPAAPVRGGRGAGANQ